MLLELAAHCLSWLALSVGFGRSSSLESEQQETRESEREPRAAVACQPEDSGLEVTRAHEHAIDDEEDEEEEEEKEDVEEDEEEDEGVCFLATKTAQPEEKHGDDSIEALVGGAEIFFPAPETDDAFKTTAEVEASSVADARSESPERVPAVNRLESSFIDNSALEVLLGDITCIICFEILRGKTLTVAMCGHIYHKACLDASPGDILTCPQCRRPVDEPRQHEEDRGLQRVGSSETMQQLLSGHLGQRQARGQSSERVFASASAGGPPAALFSPRNSQVLAGPELPSLGSPGVSGREPLPPWLQAPSQPQDRPSRPARAAQIPPWEPWQAGPLVSPSVSQAALPGREPMPPWLPEAQAAVPRSPTGPSSSRSASPRWVGSSPRLPGHSRSPRLSTRALAESQTGLLSHAEIEIDDRAARANTTGDGPVRPDQTVRFHRNSFSGARGAYREPDAVEVGSVRLQDGPVRIDQQIRSPHSFRAFREIETIHGIP